LSQQGFVSVSALAQRFSLTDTSIRRELIALEALGLIARLRGGARLASDDKAISSFEIRTHRMATEKHSLAEAAMRYVCPNNTIILDSGTTTFHLANQLSANPISDLAIITNSYPIISILSNKYPLIFIGGTVDNNALATIGPLAETSLDGIMADVAFISCTGINVNMGLTIQSQFHTGIKRSIIHHANKRVALVTSDKFLVVGGNFFCSLDDIDVLITDAVTEANEKQLDRIRNESNIEIIVLDS